MLRALACAYLVWLGVREDRGAVGPPSAGPGMIGGVLAEDERHLRRALALAEHGRLGAHPNPMVGAVVSRAGHVIGEGFHRRFGELHAERAALDDCRQRGEDPRGATMHVTLEPCTHTGKQPPCAPAILESGIARVVIGAEDPSRRASGAAEALRAAGVDVEVADGPVARDARLLVQPFRKHAMTGRPHVVLKLALSLDGRLAAASGESRWITGPESRALVHRWRAEADAVCVGSGSALADDPLLTVRDSEAERQPARVVFDSQARLPLDSALVRTAAEAPVIVVCGPDADSARIAALGERGVEVEVVGGNEAAAAREGLEALGRRGIAGVLCEGGPTLAAALFEAGEIDELRVFVAPVLIGGAGTALAIAGAGATHMSEALRLSGAAWESVGEDVLLRALLREW